MAKPVIEIKRIYEGAVPDDGFRVLVDRLWPRGVSKAEARIDLWAKDAAPSPALRSWFSHDPAKWDLFKNKYMAELQENASLDAIKDIISKKDKITLVYAAKDKVHNHAAVLKSFLEGQRLVL